MEQVASKTVRERSPLYPQFTINEILDFIQEINKIGGKKVSINTIASVLDTSVKTNAFKSKISTAKQFGLIRGTGGVVETTELAKRILFPVNDNDTHKAIIESFLSAPLYQKIVERYENRALPTIDKLGNILLLEYHLTKNAKNIAAEKFIESAEQIGILKNGIITSEFDENDFSHDMDSVNESDKNISEDNNQNNIFSQSEKTGYCFTIPTLSGSVVQINIPQDVTEKDLDFITMYIKNLLPAFIDNLREEVD